MGHWGSPEEANYAEDKRRGTPFLDRVSCLVISERRNGAGEKLLAPQSRNGASSAKNVAKGC